MFSHTSCVQNLKKIHDIEFHGVADLTKNDPNKVRAGFPQGINFVSTGFPNV